MADKEAPETPPTEAVTSDMSPNKSEKAQDQAWEAAQAAVPDWEQRRREQANEYGTWVATGPITIGGALAFVAGHAVPNTHVDKYGLDRREGADGNPLVVKRATKAGKELLEMIAARQRGD